MMLTQNNISKRNYIQIILSQNYSTCSDLCVRLWVGGCPSAWYVRAGNTKGGSITVPLTSCMTCLESAL